MCKIRIFQILLILIQPGIQYRAINVFSTYNIEVFVKKY